MHDDVAADDGGVKRARYEQVGFDEHQPSVCAGKLQQGTHGSDVCERSHRADDVVALREQLLDDARGDEAGGAGDEDARHQ